MEASSRRSRHARSRITRGTLYCGLYAVDAAAAAAAVDAADVSDEDDVIMSLSWRKDPDATW